VIIARFRVATCATGKRRQVYVHVYDDRLDMARAHAAARRKPFDEASTVLGGVAIQQGYRWPSPDVTPPVVMRLCTDHLTSNVIAHEAVHCATSFYFMDCVPGWESRARTTYIGDHEPLAYCVGEITSDVIAGLHRRGLVT